METLPPFVRNFLLGLSALAAGYVFKIMVALFMRFFARRKLAEYSLTSSLFYRLSKSITWLIPLMLLNGVLPLMELTKPQFLFLEKMLSIMLIIVTAFVLVAIVKVVEDFFLHIYDLNKSDSLRERKIRTQLQFLRKLLIGLIVILAVGAILLSFNSLRRIGTGLLTGVGISGIIVGFAAQRSLANLLAGIQIAFTQPFRIDDILVVEGEFGSVEEITLTYVVLNIWDERRLILPINYFLEKPFQNWTRNSSEILGTVFIYLDYAAPIEAIRSEFLRLVNSTDLWDKRFANLQMTNATESAVQLRMVVSAANANNAFDLRCYLREHMIAYIQSNYPLALPLKRNIVVDEKMENNKA